MYPLQIVDTAGGLARRPLPRHARWVASSRCIGCRSELLQLVAIRTDDLPAALRPRQHLGGHVDVIARYPSTVHPQYPGALISRSLPPGVSTFIRAQCHDPLPTAKEAKKKKSPEEKPAYLPIPPSAFPTTNQPRVESPRGAENAPEQIEARVACERGKTPGRRSNPCRASRPLVLVLRIRAPYWCSCR